MSAADQIEMALRAAGIESVNIVCKIAAPRAILPPTEVELLRKRVKELEDEITRLKWLGGLKGGK